jgi:nucleotide-binding universal stress UspA family protein
MYGSIVVGTDGSETADRAVARAAQLAEQGGATLHVVIAYEPAAAHVGADAAEFTIRPDFKADAVLSRTSDLTPSSVEVKTHSPTGDPADALLEVAQREGADVIVLGSRGMHGARRLLGSVPNKVSHHASCDVLIVRTD